MVKICSGRDTWEGAL